MSEFGFPYGAKGMLPMCFPGIIGRIGERCSGIVLCEPSHRSSFFSRFHPNHLRCQETRRVPVEGWKLVLRSNIFK